MSYYSIGDSFKWFMARVVNIHDPEKIGRVQIRVIHDQTGDLGKKTSLYGLTDEELLWAYPISAIQSASLSWKKIDELEGYSVPDWIDAVGLSPTGIAVGTYAFGFYLDGAESNIPLIFGTYHKVSMYPEPGQNPQTMLQDNPDHVDNEPLKYFDVGALARGKDDKSLGQVLPKAPYSYSELWNTDPKKVSPVDEHPTSYNTEYPYNTTYTTKSGHAIELDDTPNYERVHIWHRSGSYEEISSAKQNPAEISKGSTLPRDWPNNGPAEWNYITAGGVSETSWIGRRVRKTMNSQFDITELDLNQLVKRDHNVSIANTETIKIGGTVHVTVGWDAKSAEKDLVTKRVNDNLKSDYTKGSIGSGNYFLDIKNNYQSTILNNHVLSVGYAPKDERRLDDKDIKNYYRDVKQNTIITTFNNYVLGVGIEKEQERELENTSFGSYWLDVSGNHTTNVGLDIIVKARQKELHEITDRFQVTAASMVLDAAANLELKSGSGVTIDAPAGVLVKGVLTATGGLSGGASGSFAASDGKTITVTNGVITQIS